MVDEFWVLSQKQLEHLHSHNMPCAGFFLQALTVKFRPEAAVVIIIVKGTLYRWDIFVQAIMLNCCMPK